VPARRDRANVNEARLVNLQRSHHAYGPTKFEKGQNTGATGQYSDPQEQCRGHHPQEFASAKAVFPPVRVPHSETAASAADMPNFSPLPTF
jgi:hypothetical protein